MSKSSIRGGAGKSGLRIVDVKQLAQSFGHCGPPYRVPARREVVVELLSVDTR